VPLHGPKNTSQMDNLPVDSLASTNAFFCVSLNAAIDTRLRFDEFVPGRVNRVSSVQRAPGGKAAHVAMALKALSGVPTWIGFAGGATGDELLAGLRSLDIDTLPVPVAESTRVNLEILDARGEVTEILEPGGAITEYEWSEFLRVCAAAFQRFQKKTAHKKIASISGSLPLGVPAEAYAKLVSLAHSADCLAFVDSSGLGLSKVLAAGPDFVKINREEAQLATQVTIHDVSSAAEAARKLLDFGANSAAVSLGERGLVGVRKGDPLTVYARTNPLSAVSTVGCGDAALAGFAFAAANDLSFEQSLAFATACGAANCLAALPGRIMRDDISRIERDVYVERLE
jgi:1-phosphofructokinase family hexose kinase